MGGVANLRPVSVPPGAIELRVHGVSGTPAEGLLRDSAVLVAGTPTSGFSRTRVQSEPLQATDPGIIEAYTWGGLTSGTRITSALRLLLLPFALVNVAGWMLPGTTADDGAPTVPTSPSSGGRVAAHQTLARFLALGLTVYTILGAYWIAAIALERLPRVVEWWPAAAEPWRAFATLAASCVLIALWAIIARRKARVPTGRAAPKLAEEDQQQLATAPASATSGKASVLSLFSYPATTRHLSRIHALAGTGVAIILVSRDLGGGGSHGPLLAVGGLLGLAAVVMLLLFSLRNVVFEGARPVITTVVVWVVIAAAVGYAFVVAGGAAVAGARLARASSTFGTAILIVAVVGVVLAVAQWVVALRGGPRWTRLHAGAFTTVAYGTAITAVAGGSVLVNRALDGPESVVSPSGFTYTVAIVGLVSVSAALIVVLLNWANALRVGSAAWFRGLRATTARARDAILWGAGVFLACAVGLTAAAVTAQVRGLEPTELIAHPVSAGLGWAAWGWVVLAALPAAAIASSVVSGWRTAVLLVLGTAVIVGIAVLAGSLYARTRPGAGAVAWSAWLEDADRAFAELAIWAAFIAPLAAVGMFIVRGSRDATTRRMVGVLWDLISYWPRHFHPWAPAPYTDTTIPELADRTASLVRSSGASTVIISAHSQGAIVAVPAVEALRARGVPANRVALLTYGQLLDSHYRWLFPWVFNPDLFHLVDDYLDGRWINLYRTTDPLGQPVAALPDDRNRVNDGGLELDLGPTTKPKVLNHSDYWYGEAYQPALDELGG